MRTTERLRAIKEWAYKNLCEGRIMKAPSPDGDFTKICRQEPRVFLGWQPSRPDSSGYLEPDPISVCPAITIMPNAAHAKYVEEKRFDRYNRISRTQEIGQGFNVNMLFSVYEPGIRLPGYTDTQNIDRVIEGTEEGLFTLYNWMDDCVEKLLSIKEIPNSDLFVMEAEMTYSLYTDQSYIVDKRPVFYGFVNLECMGYANEHVEPEINKYL